MATITLKRIMVYKGGPDADAAASKNSVMADSCTSNHSLKEGFSSCYYPMLLTSDDVYSGNTKLTLSKKNPTSGTYQFQSLNGILKMNTTCYNDVEHQITDPDDGGPIWSVVWISTGWNNPGKPDSKNLDRFESVDETRDQTGFTLNQSAEGAVDVTEEHLTDPKANDYLMVSTSDAFQLYFLHFDDEQHYTSGDSSKDLYKIKIHSATLTLTYTFTYEAPSINNMSDLTIKQVKNTDGSINNASRKLLFSWKQNGYSVGVSPYEEMKTVTKATYRLYDTSGNNNIIIYTCNAEQKKQTATKQIKLYAAVYGSNRSYKLLMTLYNNNDSIASSSVTNPGIIANAPSMLTSSATKLVGNTATEEDLFDQISTGSVLTDESVTLKWTNPVIAHAEGLRVNYEIVVSTDGINFTHLDYIYSEKSDCPKVKANNTILENQPDSSQDQYVNSYVINKDVLNSKGIKNYQTVYVGVKVLIKSEYNDKITYETTTTSRTIKETKQELISFNQDMIERFICVYECNVHYCPDGFTWKKCLVYYCPEGEKWVPVVLRWSPTGDHWVYC